jgi:hypothetical protein
MNARSIAPYALVALVAVLWRYTDAQQERRIGAAEQRAATATHARDSLKAVKDSLAKASVAQVETLRVSVVRRVPVLDTVEVFLRDTVPVPVEIVRELVRVDSAVIHACMVALGTCEHEKSVLRLDIIKTEQQRDAYKAQIPSGFQSMQRSVRDMAIGAALVWVFGNRGR